MKGQIGSTTTIRDLRPRTIAHRADREPRKSHGEVHVVSRVVGFKKIKFYTNENVGSGELDLPEQQMHTTSYWLTIPSAVMGALPYGGDDRRDGVIGLAFAMRHVAQLLLMCDRHDVGVSIDGGSLEKKTRTGGVGGVPEALAAEPNIFIYDNYPGGIGFSRPLFDMHAPLLERTRELITGCPCESGCPSCVGPEGNTGPHAKLVASEILDRLLTACTGRDRTERPVPVLDGLCEAVARGRRSWIVATPLDRRPPTRPRELTYEPDTGRYEATIDIDRVADVLGGRVVTNKFGRALIVDRRYESDRFHGTRRVGDCDVQDGDTLSCSIRGCRRLTSGSAPAAPMKRCPDAVRRSRDDGAERRRGHGGVSGRLRLVRHGRVPGPPVPAHQLRERARAAVRRRRVLRRDRRCSSPTTARRSTCR